MAQHRIFTGRLPDGTHVLVQVWDTAAEIAFRDDPRTTWGVPTNLDEVAS